MFCAKQRTGASVGMISQQTLRQIKPYFVSAPVKINKKKTKKKRNKNARPMRFSLGDGAVYSCTLIILRQSNSNQFDEGTIATVANRM